MEVHAGQEGRLCGMSLESDKPQLDFGCVCPNARLIDGLSLL